LCGLLQESVPDCRSAARTFKRCVASLDDSATNLKPISDLSSSVGHLPSFQELSELLYSSTKVRFKIFALLVPTGLFAEEWWLLFKAQKEHTEAELGILFMADILSNCLDHDSGHLGESSEPGVDPQNAARLLSADLVDKTGSALSSEIAGWIVPHISKSPKGCF
jgi:hypothetical protein